MRPFLTVDLLKLKDRDITEIAKFQKGVIDVDNILNSAENLKYSRLIKDCFAEQIESPSPEFVKFILNYVYDGVKTQKIIEDFTPIVKRAISQYINDSMNTKIKAALNNQDESDDSNIDDVPETAKDTKTENKEHKIITTIEELESYAIIKSILLSLIHIFKIGRDFRQRSIYGISSMRQYQHSEMFRELFPADTFRFICRLTFALRANSSIIVFHRKPVGPEAVAAPGAHRFIFLFVIYDIGFLDHIFYDPVHDPCRSWRQVKRFFIHFLMLTSYSRSRTFSVSCFSALLIS